MNENFIKDLHIQNFKSIKDLKLDCKRINLFIGKPNVGKSNILEGVSLLADRTDFSNEFFKYIRYDKLHNLFFESEIKVPIIIESDTKTMYLSFNKLIKEYVYCTTNIKDVIKDIHKNHGKELNFNIFNNIFLKIRSWLNYDMEQDDKIWLSLKKQVNNELVEVFDVRLGMKDSIFVEDLAKFNISSYSNDGSLKKKHIVELFYQNFIKCYKFKGDYSQLNNYDEELNWPNGNNIISVLERNKSLRLQVGEIFKEYGYSLLIDKTTGEIGIQKSQDGIVFRLPLDFVADTLKRFIFHLAAIKSNENSVLIFEEPEAHCFPQYISIIAEEIINSTSNQFFIATHSPYILNDILEKADREDVAVHLTYFENYETKVKTLSSQELSELADYGVDIFFNIENYLPHAN